tara:strand:+ start:689 stop:1096 length:408 start_codon:yes stop_codon:yes gene_type:complete
MAKQPNLERARLQSEAYAKMIRNMINALNSDLVDLKVKEDRIKLIPVKKDDTPKEMFKGYDRSFKNYMDYIPPSASPSTQKRIEKKFNEIQKERMKFMGRASMQRGDKRTLEQKKNDGAREPMRGRDFQAFYERE